MKNIGTPWNTWNVEQTRAAHTHAESISHKNVNVSLEDLMPILNNPRHEHFAQLVASGLSPTDAYVAVGFSKNGAHASSHRLQRTPAVSSRVAELRAAVAERTLEKAA